ncbi:HAMP domain-containing histidine kinase [Parasphingopyxis algicola]|uniref:sensor histidine kinase n=1 Tax=Parasphingopyxis algicola TaxID=2026624 RepID=UPI0015A242AF|nr:HAMP domain-containing sensor histidine kinase [Parasphingopyxis algicola]QLC24365.1 HAMP domain-containing histidine kinase [Parasphingopyxis algicola]
MNGMASSAGQSFGRLDEKGSLVAADAALEELHMRAGGVPGGSLAIPQIAALAKLASRLGIAVSRSVIAADGDRDVELHIQAEPDSDGVKLAVGGWVSRDPASPAGRDPELREHDFLRADADWLWETDHTLRLTALSPDADKMLGAADSFVGQPLTGLFRFVERDDGTLPILNALAEHRRFERQEAVLRPEGAQRVELTAVPLIDGSGRFAGFRGTAVAVEAKPDRPGVLHGETEVPNAFGRQINRALRAPLDRIVASAHSIEAQIDGPIRGDYAEYAGDIARAGRHLLGLIDDLADLQAVERDDFEPEIQDIDLADIARDAAGLLSVRASEKKIRIDRPADDESLPARADYKRVLQILVNLVGNAVRFSPEDSQIWIRCETEGDLAAVIVADQGRGIAPEDQPRIFEKFERLSADEPGTGLGLYIARRLARAMGGDIDVDSAPGQGARFVLTLPVGD